MVLASHHSATWTDTQGRGYLLTSTQHTFLSGLRSHQPPALPTCLSPSPPLVPQIYSYHSSWAGTAPCTCFTSSVHVHTSTVPDATTNTLGTVSVPSCLTRQLTPFRASAGSTPHTHKVLGWVLTPLIRLQLCLQVFRRYVEFCLFTLRCLGLALPTAAVKATAQTAAAVAAGEEATDNEQGLGKRILALYSLKGP